MNVFDGSTERFTNFQYNLNKTSKIKYVIKKYNSYTVIYLVQYNGHTDMYKCSAREPHWNNLARIEYSKAGMPVVLAWQPRKVTAKWLLGKSAILQLPKPLSPQENVLKYYIFLVQNG